MSLLPLQEVNWDLSLNLHYVPQKTTQDPDQESQWRQVGKHSDLKRMEILTLYPYSF